MTPEQFARQLEARAEGRERLQRLAERDHVAALRHHHVPGVQVEGRADFPGGSARTLYRSIRKILETLPPETPAASMSARLPLALRSTW